VVSHSNIDNQRHDNTNPDWDVVGIDANEAPFGVNPTLKLQGCQFDASKRIVFDTHDCVAKDWTTRIVSNRDENNSGQQWTAKTYETVEPEILAKYRRVGIEEEDQEDIKRHGK
jgi:hypothetical protein